jgi:geranylgeranyl pyrophosphate synthase
MFESALKKAIYASGFGDLAAVMEYAVLPAGKLFRPNLVQCLAEDLGNNFTPDHLQLALAIEIHHAYTLVHDDLPAMDNDLMRRGKPSTHARFGEWQAILAGDALLILSFKELLRIRHPHAHQLHRLFTWASGARGLILGQYLDLKAQGKLTFPETLRVHELKTGRLIQAVTLGSLLLSRDKHSTADYIRFMRLGRDIGVAFQLMDDEQELASGISSHEEEINAFIQAPAAAKRELNLTISRIKATTAQYKLKKTKDMLTTYFEMKS